MVNVPPVPSQDWKFLVGFFVGMWVTCIIVANTVPPPSQPPP